MRTLLNSTAAAALIGITGPAAGWACDAYRTVGLRAPTRDVYYTVAPSVVDQPVVVVPTVTVVETPVKVVQVDHRPLVEAGATLQSHVLFLGEQLVVPADRQR